MRKIWRRWWTRISLLLFIVAYVIWWNRSANFTISEVEDGFFALPTRETLADEENLLKTFESQEVQDFISEFAPFLESDLGKKNGLKVLPYGVSGVSEVTKTLLEKKGDSKEKKMLTLEEFVTTERFLSFKEKSKEIWFLTQIMQDISEKERFFVPTGDTFFSQYQALWAARKVKSFLFALWADACSAREQTKCDEYLSAIYLLWDKVSENNSHFFAISGISWKREVLSFALFLQGNSRFLIQGSKLFSLVSQDRKTPDEHYLNIIKHDFLLGVSYLEAQSKIIFDWAKPFVFDMKESRRILKEMLYLQRKNKDMTGKEWEERMKTLDSRRNNPHFNWIANKRDMESYWEYLFYSFMDVWEEIKPLLQRKNLVGVETIGVFSYPENSQFLEEYYMLQQVFLEEGLIAH